MDDTMLAGKIVRKILVDLVNRRGLGDEWEQIDETVQDEIRVKWERIIVKLLESRP